MLEALRAWVVTQHERVLSETSVLAALQLWVAAHAGTSQAAPGPSRSAASPSPATSALVTTAPTPAPPAAHAQAALTTSHPSGCAAALAYLAAHAAPGFVSSCPHPDGAFQATTTCMNAPQCSPGTAFIWIADPCPAAYMNEASNSWVIVGQSSAPIDPFGYCGQAGNPYG